MEPAQEENKPEMESESSATQPHHETFPIDVVNCLTGEVLTSIQDMHSELPLSYLRTQIAKSLKRQMFGFTLMLGENPLASSQDASSLGDLGICKGTFLGCSKNRVSRVYNIGGWNNPDQVGTAEFFDFVADGMCGAPEELPPMPCPRAGHCAVAVGGQIVVLGGYDGVNKLASVVSFDIDTATWKSLPSMSTQRTCPAAVLIDGKIHVWGGKSAFSQNSGEAFDPTENAWSSLPPMLFARELYALVLHGSTLYAIGGYGFDFEGEHTGNYLQTVESMNIHDSSWTMISPLSKIRAEMTAVACDSKIYVIGGTDNVLRYSDAEILDTETGEWTTLEQNMTMERTSPRAITIHDQIYVFGGLTNGREVTTNCEIYNTKEQKWTSFHVEMLKKRCLQAVVVVECMQT